MADNSLKVLITANLNVGRSIGDINRQIREIEKRINKLNIKINIDNKLLSAIGKMNAEFNKLAKSIATVSNVDNKLNSTTQQATNSINQQTQAINEQAKSVENLKRVKERYNGAGVKTGESITTGDKFTSVTENRTHNKDGSITTTGSVKDFNADKLAQAEKKRIQDVDRAHAQAFKEKTKREEHLGDVSKRVHDKVMAQALAERENRRFDANALKNAKSYEDFWLKSLKQRDMADARQAASQQARQSKAAKDYENLWGKALLEREQKEKRFYNSQLSRVGNAKQSALSGVESTKAADMLGRQYDKITQKMQQMQASGKVLTQQDIDGINRRIQRLDGYRKSQVQLETNTRKLTAIQNQAEAQVLNLQRRFGNKVDTGSLNNYIQQIRQISPASKDAIKNATQLKSEIDRVGASANSASAHALNLSQALQTAMIKMPVNLSMRDLNFSNCWKTLRVSNATT